MPRGRRGKARLPPGGCPGARWGMRAARGFAVNLHLDKQIPWMANRRPRDVAWHPATVGAVAQMGERCNRTAEVRGSIPLGSTNLPRKLPVFRRTVAGIWSPATGLRRRAAHVEARRLVEAAEWMRRMRRLPIAAIAAPGRGRLARAVQY
jgi:hypothetical protein